MTRHDKSRQKREHEIGQEKIRDDKTRQGSRQGRLQSARQDGSRDDI